MVDLCLIVLTNESIKHIHFFNIGTDSRNTYFAAKDCSNPHSFIYLDSSGATHVSKDTRYVRLGSGKMSVFTALAQELWTSMGQLVSMLSFVDIAATILRCHTVRTVISSHSVYNFSGYFSCLP